MRQQQQISEIMGHRFKNFITRNKDRFICYRFVVELEKMLPHDKSQLHISQAVMDGEIDTADELVVETTPRGVYERYIEPMYMNHFVTHEQIEEMSKLVHQYCRYLKSTPDDRIRYYGEDKEAWDKFI